VEVDARTVPWMSLDRLLLEAGLFPPPYQPVSRAELAALLDKARHTNSAALQDPAERERLAELLRRYGATDVTASGVRFGGRLLLCQTDLGDVWEGEAGLNIPGGLSASLEPLLAAWSGSWWLAATPRWRGRLLESGGSPPQALLYTGWPAATGRPQVARARRDGGRWRLDWPRAVVGRRCGRWSLSLGWAPRRVGPGRTGTLTLDRTGRSFPALTVRRTAPFAWQGLARHVAPTHLLIRVGLLSAQDLSYLVEALHEERRDEPWFMEWLLTFRHTAWLRTTVSAAALAAPRSGTLWPDLLQINFPQLGATHDEVRRGPLTDRIFTLQFEARWRRAPWPLLPAAAGRLYWEYAGEDYAPGDVLHFVPQISAPASVAGLELLSPRWDLAAEFAELEHPKVLWYAHSNFRSGYAHEGWLLGDPLGGTGRLLAGWLRWRPKGRTWELELSGRHERWDDPVHLPGRAERDCWSIGFGRPCAPLHWRSTLAWIREEATLALGIPSAARNWLRLTCQLGF
jgi:hypothetical protein